MGISSVVLPDDSPCLQESYDLSVETVNRAIQVAAPNSYRNAVYNLGGDIVINTAPDVDGSTFFADLRAKWNVLDPTSGVVQSSNDVSTGQAFVVPEQASTFTLGDLQNLAAMDEGRRGRRMRGADDMPDDLSLAGLHELRHLQNNVLDGPRAPDPHVNNSQKHFFFHISLHPTL